MWIVSLCVRFLERHYKVSFYVDHMHDSNVVGISNNGLNFFWVKCFRTNNGLDVGSLVEISKQNDFRGKIISNFTNFRC